MKELKKILRVLALTLLILLALSGVGIIGAFFSNNRERYRDKEIKIELVDTDRKENEAELDDYRT